MTASTVFFLLLVLACPLMMIFMMRGGHGHGGAHGDHAGSCHAGRTQNPDPPQMSTDDLRRQRDELDHLIEEREQSERELTPTAGPRP